MTDGGEARRPVLMVKVPLRGRTGGSFFLRWAYGRAMHEGREVDFADFDRSDGAMSRWFRETVGPAIFYDGGLRSGRFGTCIVPASAHMADMVSGLTRCVEGVAETGRSLIVDTTGGDPAFLDYAERLCLSEVCREAGISLLAAAMCGPGEQDISGVLSLLRTRLFAPGELALVCNEGLVPDGMATEEAFASFLPGDRRSKAVGLLEKEGARVVVLPRFDFADAVERAKVDVFEAQDMACPALGVVQRVNTRAWLFGAKGRAGVAEFMRPLEGRLP